jgi:hypothetical protein
MTITLNGTTGIQNVLGSAAAPAESNTTNSNTGLYFPTSTTLGLSTAGTNAVYIDASQNVGLNNNVNLQYKNSSGTYLSMLTLNGSNNFIYGPSGAFTGAHIWYSSGAERMRIDSSGNLLLTSGDININQTTAGYSNSNGFSNGINQQYQNHISGTGSGTGYIQFGYAGAGIGSITQNGTTGVLYNLTSDYRLKNDIQTLTGAKDFVMALQPKKWQWWDGSGEGVGFIAHEFMEVAKYSGHGEKDAVDADGKPVMQSIQPSSSEVIANLVAHIQNLETRLAALEAR